MAEKENKRKGRNTSCFGKYDSKQKKDIIHARGVYFLGIKVYITRMNFASKCILEPRQTF